MIEQKEIRFSFDNVSQFTEFATLSAHMPFPRLYPFTMKGLVTIWCFLGCAESATLIFE